MKILYGVCNLGLGHATRSLPLIKALIARGDEVYILSTGNALALLKKELGSSVKAYIDYPGYPPMERGYGKKTFYFLLLGDLTRTGKMILQERIYTSKLAKQYDIDMTITDGRYGVFTLMKPSIIITHQLHFASMLFEKLAEKGTELANSLHFTHFTRIVVPDFASLEYSVSGKLSHNVRLIPISKIRYIGISSSYEKIDIEQDIDYLFVISGFIADEKKTFISKLLSQAKELKGKKVFLLGNPSGGEKEELAGNITVYPYISGEDRITFMNRAKMIVGRAGYTTLMDLAELEKKALIVPTPGMSEQEYLARYHKSKGTLYSVSQDEINLARDVEVAQSFSGIKPLHKTAVSVKNFLRIVDSIKQNAAR